MSGKPARPGARGAGRIPAAPRPDGSWVTAIRRWRRAASDVDRVVLMRVALLAIVLAFLYLFVRVSIEAFGGGGARGVWRMEQAVDSATRGAPPRADGEAGRGSTPRAAP